MKKSFYAAVAMTLALAVTGAGLSFADGLKIQRQGGNTGSTATSGCDPTYCDTPYTSGGHGGTAVLAPATATLEPTVAEGTGQPTDGPGFGNTTSPATATAATAATQRLSTSAATPQIQSTASEALQTRSNLLAQ